MMTKQKSNRGGYRPGAGRKPLPGNLQRRDARIEEAFITLAVHAGEGNFSDGLRRMLTYSKRVWRRPIDRYEPPTGQPLLVLDDSGWRVATLVDGSWIQAGTENEIGPVAVWCCLPPTPGELAIMDLPL